MANSGAMEAWAAYTSPKMLSIIGAGGTRTPRALRCDPIATRVSWRGMSISVEQLFAALEHSGLLTPAEVHALRESYRATPLNAVEGPILARELVSRQVLTAYQADAVCRGDASSLILGNYVLLEKLGQGGMGTVYKARQRRMERVVALKVLLPNVARRPQSIRRFQREVIAAARLDHPHIVATLDAEEFHGKHLLVMQFAEGSDLSSLVKKQGPLPMARAIDCIVQAARGLEYAHGRGVIHRDIKPSNLLLDATGTLKILDMGLARIMNDDDEGPADPSLTNTGAVMGTVDYMSPEQAANTKAADARSDIYSLGCTLHFLLRGKSVYGGGTAVERIIAHREQPIPPLFPRPAVDDSHPADVPHATVLEAIFQRMVAKRADDRFQSMSEVIAALVPLCGGSAGYSKPDGPVAVVERAGHSGGSRSPANSAPSGMKVWLITGGIATVACALIWTLGGFGGRSRATNTPASAQPSGDKVTSATASPRDSNSASVKSPLTAGLAERERQAAEWVLSQGGAATVRIGEGELRIDAGQQLPPGEFRLIGADLGGKTAVIDSRLGPLLFAENLEVLSLELTGVGDRGLKGIAGLKHLRYLNLSQTATTNLGLAHLRGHPALREIRLYSMSQVTDFGLEHLAEIPRLEHLDLYGNAAITDQGARFIGRIKNLKWLDLSHSSIGNAALESIRELQQLEYLALPGSVITDEGTAHLASLRKLTSLRISLMPITDRGLATLTVLTGLAKLDLQETAITDTGLAGLTPMNALRSLILHGTPVTLEGVTKLSMALPECKIASDFGHYLAGKRFE